MATLLFQEYSWCNKYFIGPPPPIQYFRISTPQNVWRLIIEPRSGEHVTPRWHWLMKNIHYTSNLLFTK